MPTERAQNIRPFIVMDVMAAAEEMEANGENIIHFEVGEPGFPTPDCITEAAVKALKDNKTTYTHSLGLLTLRQEISNYYKSTYNVNVHPDQILVSSGTSPALLLLFMSLLDKDQEIILNNPYYPCYPNFINFIGGKPVFINTREENGFVMDVNELKGLITDKTRAVLINSPANPTGVVMPRGKMQEIAELNVPYVISDEIYHQLNYSSDDHTILEFTDKAFVINGFSKAYSMTGWRLGYIIVPKQFSRVVQKLHQNFFISANRFVQEAGIAALKYAGEEVNKMKTVFDSRRIFMLKRIREIGFKVDYEPAGAFYILANARHFSNDSYNLAFDILKNAKVALTPGIDFGESAQGYLRFCYSNSMENIEEGMSRLEKYINERYA